ncbi:hypothetical protein M9434_002259 [Picochlorum sp. BPE23]|nr:hypothetical protein M9434_002259 [Picochlorum sp. BPE23]
MTPAIAAQRRGKKKDTEAEPPPWAYVSLLYGDEFLLGLRVLGQSLQASGTRADRVAIVAGPVRHDTISILEQDGWKVRTSEIVQNPGDVFPPKFSGVYTKLRIFGDTTYDRIVFLDADTIVVENIDSLFLCNGFCAVLRHSERFNSGVMAIQPAAFDVDDMLSHIKDMPSYTGGDQGFLNEYLKGFAEAPMFYPERGILLDSSKNTTHGKLTMGRLPTQYNADLGLFVLNRNRWAIDTVRVIHYTLGPVKPWAWWSYWVLGHDAMAPWLAFRQALHPGGPVALPIQTPSRSIQQHSLMMDHRYDMREWYVYGMCVALLGMGYRRMISPQGTQKKKKKKKQRSKKTAKTAAHKTAILLPSTLCMTNDQGIHTHKSNRRMCSEMYLALTAYGLLSLFVSAAIAFYATPQQLSPWAGCAAFFLLFSLMIPLVNNICLEHFLWYDAPDTHDGDSSVQLSPEGDYQLIMSEKRSATIKEGHGNKHIILLYAMAVALFVYPAYASILLFDTIWTRVFGSLLLEGLSVFLYLHLVLPRIAIRISHP